MHIADLNMKYILTGLFMGIMSGFLGIGGGVILIPILISYFAFEQHAAHVISLSVVLPVAITGAIIYGFNGDVDFLIGAQLAVGGMIGAAIGARVMQKLPAATLKKLFGILLMVVGFRMLIS